MEIRDLLRNKIALALKENGVEVELNDILVEVSKDVTHGDYATNVALKYSRNFQKSPRDVASLIVSKIEMSDIDHIEIAGPGFINFYMKKDSIAEVVNKIINEDKNYGRSEKKNKKINVEFVSANPTGDLHVGHARGAAIGDAISRILEFDGYEVTREYYINDAGSQIDHLGESLIARYKEILGLPFSLPEDGYHGEDVKLIARKIYDKYGDKLLERDDVLEFFKTVGQDYELDKIKEDLAKFNIVFDVFSSEKKIRSNNAVENDIKDLVEVILQEEVPGVVEVRLYE